VKSRLAGAKTPRRPRIIMFPQDTKTETMGQAKQRRETQWEKKKGPYKRKAEGRPKAKLKKSARLAR